MDALVFPYKTTLWITTLYYSPHQNSLLYEIFITVIFCINYIQLFKLYEILLVSQIFASFVIFGLNSLKCDYFT